MANLGALLDNISPIQPPEGLESNFVNPANQGYLTIAISSILIGIMFACLVVRLYAKAFIAHRATWDDLTCTIAALGATAYFVCAIIGIVDGPIGKHLWDVSDAEIESGSWIIPVTFLGVILVPLTLLFAKVTILILYLELFRPLRWMRVCVYIGVTITSLYYIGFEVAQIFLALPKNGENWYSHLQSPQADTLETDTIPFAAGGLGIDLFILILPLKAVMALQMKPRKKLAIAMVFLTGLLACVASTLSIWYRLQGTIGNDFTFTTNILILTGIIEMCVGVIIACMPSLSKVVRHHLAAFKAIGSALSSPFTSARRALLPNESTPFSSAARTILRPESPTPSQYEASVNTRLSRDSHSDSRPGHVSPLSIHNEAKSDSQPHRTSHRESKSSETDLDLPIEGTSDYTRSSANSLRAQEEGLSYGMIHKDTEKIGLSSVNGHDYTSKEKPWRESHDIECAWYEASGG